MSIDFTNNVLNMQVELIEYETIDIDNIEELNVGDTLNNKIIRDKFNKLIQAIKHLNKEIQSIKERM